MIPWRFTICTYVSESGESPFEEWMMSRRDVQTRMRLYRRINKLRQGNPGDFKKVDGIIELREDFAGGLRIYCAIVDSETLLLLCGGDKSTQRDDIKRARKFLSDYRRRKPRKPNE